MKFGSGPIAPGNEVQSMKDHRRSGGADWSGHMHPPLRTVAFRELRSHDLLTTRNVFEMFQTSPTPNPHTGISVIARHQRSHPGPVGPAVQRLRHGASLDQRRSLRRANSRVLDAACDDARENDRWAFPFQTIHRELSQRVGHERSTQAGGARERHNAR